MTPNRKFLAFAGLALPAVVFAQGALLGAQVGATVDTRQASQEIRIQQGLDSGSLTQREANKLERGQAAVQRLEDRAQADGNLTGKEARRLDRALDKQSDKIAREKDDRQHDFNRDGKLDLPRVGR